MIFAMTDDLTCLVTIVYFTQSGCQLELKKPRNNS